jgi:opacity protein-like surface antigen
MRHRPFLTKWLALPALGVFSSFTAATGQVSAGVQAEWGSETDFGVGARGIVGLGVLVNGLETVVSFDYFFPSDRFGAERTYWEAGANLVLQINPGAHLTTPYVGAGIHVSYFEVSETVLDVEVAGDETRGGLNLLGGLIFDVGRARPFFEGRFTINGQDQFVACAGVRL